MRKLVLLFMFMLSSLLGFSQYSSITIEINDNDRAFMDTVEAKLIRHVHDIEQHKIKCDVRDYGSWRSFQGLWPLASSNWLYIDSAYPSINKNIATYKYHLDMVWDSSLSDMYVLEFSKLYSMATDWQWYEGTRVQNGKVDLPYYYIPLDEYVSFLNKYEIDELNMIIKKHFIKYVDDDTIKIHDTSMTLRTINFNTDNPFLQMPWQYWIHCIYGFGIMPYSSKNELRVYYTPKCNVLMAKGEADNSLMIKGNVMDTSGNWYLNYAVPDTFGGIIIAEEWSFDTTSLNSLYKGIKYKMKISKSMRSIGIIKEVPKMYEQWNNVGVNPVWLDAEDVDKLCVKGKYPGSLYLYKELINAVLYKKLKLRFSPNYW